MVCLTKKIQKKKKKTKKKKKKLNDKTLYVVLKNKWQWIATWLIENDVSLEYKSYEENELNLLHFVYSQQKNMEITNHLINIMFDKLKTRNRLMDLLREKDFEGNTTLDIAVKYGKYNNVKHLLDIHIELQILDSSVTNKNENQQNVLHHAAYKDCDDGVFTYLLKFIKKPTGKMEEMISI